MGRESCGVGQPRGGLLVEGWDWEGKGSGLPEFGEGSMESLREKLGMINGRDKRSHLERQENLSPITNRKLSEIADGSARCL